MSTQLEYIVERISSLNLLHAKKLKNNIRKSDNEYFIRANQFLLKYDALLMAQSKTMDYAIDCYLQMLADVNYESIQFIHSGEYSNKWFVEVNKRVYNNPEVMEYYMHGLLLSQFLWRHHYHILLFFNRIIQENKNNIGSYLEVGGGHGLYISEALEIVGNKAKYDLVDISKSSIDIARKMIENDNVTFILSDIADYNYAEKYDFITMGEVLEHVEDPILLLKKLFTLLNNNGRLFITTPTNAPAIDHIYLFNNADEIREVILAAGFEIESEFCIYSEDIPAELAEKYKVSMMYAGVLRKSQVVKT